jgi:hypothetical protein
MVVDMPVFGNPFGTECWAKVTGSVLDRFECEARLRVDDHVDPNPGACR